MTKLPPSENVITAEQRKKGDLTLFQKLLWSGPLTRRLDRIADSLNQSWRS